MEVASGFFTSFPFFFSSYESDTMIFLFYILFFWRKLGKMASF